MVEPDHGREHADGAGGELGQERLAVTLNPDAPGRLAVQQGHDPDYRQGVERVVHRQQESEDREGRGDMVRAQQVGRRVQPGHERAAHANGQRGRRDVEQALVQGERGADYLCQDQRRQGDEHGEGRREEHDGRDARRRAQALRDGAVDLKPHPLGGEDQRGEDRDRPPQRDDRGMAGQRDPLPHDEQQARQVQSGEVPAQTRGQVVHSSSARMAAHPTRRGVVDDLVQISAIAPRYRRG